MQLNFNTIRIGLTIVSKYDNSKTYNITNIVYNDTNLNKTVISYNDAYGEYHHFYKDLILLFNIREV